MKNTIFLSFITIIFLVGCIPLAQTNQERIDNKNKITLGVIQKDIKKGMSKTDVLVILGSPNLVSSDGDKETWVYDKISTEITNQQSNLSGVVVGTSGNFIGGISGSKSDNNISSSQRTLTVILKFDNQNILEKVLYHTSRF